MEHVLVVREARRRFAELLNWAAFGGERIAIVRRTEVMGAFVGPEDLEFLEKFKPVNAPARGLEAVAEELGRLQAREWSVETRERLAREHNWSESERERIRQEREQIDLETAELRALEEGLRRRLARA